MTPDPISYGIGFLISAFRPNFVEDENLKDTPDRVARMWRELLCGEVHDLDSEVNNILGTSFPSTYGGMVTISGITAWGACPHHLLPVSYKVDLAYIPDKRVVGLSKLPRLVKLLAGRLVLQEQFTDDVVQYMNRYLGCCGVMIVVEGVHHCMVCRGVREHDSVTTTSQVSGLFCTDPSTKAEFLEFRRRNHG